MKKYLFVLMMSCLTTTMFAQGLGFLKNEARVDMKLNYSEAVIAGYEESNILTFEKDWEKDQAVLFAKMVGPYNDKLGETLPAGNFSNANYTIEVRPTVIQKNGNIVGYFVVLDAAGTELYRSQKFSAKGGTFGTFLNLVGDGMKSTGKVIANMVKKELKK